MVTIETRKRICPWLDAEALALAEPDGMAVKCRNRLSADPAE